MTSGTVMPRLHVEIDGKSLESSMGDALAEVRVRHHLGRPSQCELVFRGPGGETFDQGPQTGEPLSVRVDGEGRPLFEGEVTAVQLRFGGDGEAQLRVRGYDLLYRLRLRQPVRALVEMTVADLAREMVAELGLTVEAPDAGPLRQRILQHRRNDLQLLVEEAADAGLYPLLRGDRLHLLTLEGRGETVPLRAGENLLESQFEVNGIDGCRSVEVSAWDPFTVEPHRAMAFEARCGRDIGESAPPARLGASGELTFCGGLAETDRQAEASAQAVLDRRRAAEVVLWGIADGRGDLMPGTPVEVDGVGRRFAGTYVLTAVEHRIDGDAGFVSEISTTPPPPPSNPRGRAPEVAWGTVLRVDDPQGLGRVRVQLSAHGDLESDWLEVVCPAAGVDKGLVALPDVDDLVLVLLLEGDAARGLVLGGLYGPRPPYDTGVDVRGGDDSQGAGTHGVERYTLRTTHGEQLQLDRGRGTVRLENGDGSFVELSPRQMHLRATSDLLIEAPGKTLTFRGHRIDFERE